MLPFMLVLSLRMYRYYQKLFLDFPSEHDILAANFSSFSLPVCFVQECLFFYDYPLFMVLIVYYYYIMKPFQFLLPLWSCYYSGILVPSFFRFLLNCYIFYFLFKTIKSWKLSLTLSEKVPHQGCNYIYLFTSSLHYPTNELVQLPFLIR